MSEISEGGRIYSFSQNGGSKYIGGEGRFWRRQREKGLGSIERKTGTAWAEGRSEGKKGDS